MSTQASNGTTVSSASSRKRHLNRSESDEGDDFGEEEVVSELELGESDDDGDVVLHLRGEGQSSSLSAATLSAGGGGASESDATTSAFPRGVEASNLARSGRIKRVRMDDGPQLQQSIPPEKFDLQRVPSEGRNKEVCNVCIISPLFTFYNQTKKLNNLQLHS